MTRAQLTEKILDIKREKGWTWKYICEEIGGMSPTLVVGALLGQMKFVKPLAAKAAKNFQEADRIRDALKAQGIELIDKGGGLTDWIRA